MIAIPLLLKIDYWEGALQMINVVCGPRIRQVYTTAAVSKPTASAALSCPIGDAPFLGRLGQALAAAALQRRDAGTGGSMRRPLGQSM